MRLMLIFRRVPWLTVGKGMKNTAKEMTTLIEE